MKFSCVPKIVNNEVFCPTTTKKNYDDEVEMMEEFTTRRQPWISAISRGDLVDDKLEHKRVCHRHFVCGQWDQFDVDWVSMVHLGHTKRLQRIDPQLNADRTTEETKRND